MHAVAMWSSSVPVYFYVPSVFLCSSVHSGSHFQRMSRGNILIRQKQKDVVMPKKIQRGLPKTTTYVQSANMQFIHGPITALNDETVTAKRLNHFLKIQMCLYLGQKEEKTSHTSSTSEKTISVIFIAKCDKNKTIIWCFCLFCSICSWIQRWSTANQEALYEASWDRAIHFLLFSCEGPRSAATARC